MMMSKRLLSKQTKRRTCSCLVGCPSRLVSEVCYSTMLVLGIDGFVRRGPNTVFLFRIGAGIGSTTNALWTAVTPSARPLAHTSTTHWHSSGQERMVGTDGIV